MNRPRGCARARTGQRHLFPMRRERRRQCQPSTCDQGGTDYDAAGLRPRDAPRRAPGRQDGAHVARLRARQLATDDQRAWSRELKSRHPADLAAPPWLWTTVVGLLTRHEGAYLEHCRLRGEARRDDEPAAVAAQRPCRSFPVYDGHLRSRPPDVAAQPRVSAFTQSWAAMLGNAGGEGRHAGSVVSRPGGAVGEAPAVDVAGALPP